MKKINLLSGLMLMVLMLLASCAKDNRIIEKPVFLASNTTSIEVSKVTLTDSTTVLDIFARYRPKYWIRIAGSSYLTDDKGQTYPIQKGVGIELDKEFWMPESGEAEFQLVFPRLRNGAKYFHFSEGPEVEGPFCIWGVQLKSDQLPELQLPKDILAHTVNKEAVLDAPELKFGEATIKGKMLDFQPGMPDAVNIVVYNPLSGYENVELKCEADGSFTHTLPVLATSKAYAYNNGLGVHGEFFVAPGQTSEVYLNTREGARLRSKFHAEKAPYGSLCYYNGPLADVVRESAEVQKAVMENWGASVSYDFTQKPEALLEAYKKHILDKTARLKEAVDQSSMSQAGKDYLIKAIPLQILSVLKDAVHNLAGEYYYQSQPQLSREEYAEFFGKLNKALPKDYVDEGLYASLNDPMSLLSTEYGRIVLESALSGRMYGIQEGLFAELAATSKLYRGITDFMPLTDEQKEAMKALPEACQQYLTAANDKLLTQIEANKKKTGFRVNEAGEVANEDLFASIISKFRGKVLLVDFWATWCGPCRMANKAMIPMKEELKDKDIVYVYITGETSPKGTWENMIPDIHGEHFRVTDAQWAYLGNAMGIEGVPTYFVVDREGNIKYKSVGFPGEAKMKEELLKVLGE